MKNLFLVFLWVSVMHKGYAQICGSPESQIDIYSNNIKARILNGGDLFTDFSSAQFFPNPDPNSSDNPATIFAAGIWLGGVDLGGNLKLATVDYRNDGKSDFSAGPLSLDGITEPITCSNWDRHFQVKGEQIAAFLAALPLSAAELKTQFPNIAGWPGRGNPYFADMWGFDLPATVQDLAPFLDANSDGSYDPLDGDYPAVLLRGFAPFVPAEIIWCVFNDHNGGNPHANSFGKPLQMEVQLTTWAFNSTEQPVLNNAIFTSHKIINRATDVVDSTFIGIWVDVDLGCYADDYVGCDPEKNIMYAYNQDAVDGQPGNTCQGSSTFPDAAPVQSVTLLNHSLDKFVTFGNSGTGSPPPGTTDPTDPVQFYRYLTGSWRDGAPLTFGGTGYGGNTPTDHLFPNDPSDPNGWSMCTSNISFGDRRMLGTTKIGQLQPGQVDEVVVAWAFHPNPALPCGLGSTFGDVSIIQGLYDNGFKGAGSPLRAPDLPADSLSLFPNPTSGIALLRYGTLVPLSLRAYDASGKLVLEKLGGFEKEQTKIETASLASGVYTLQLITNQGTATKKLTVVR